MTVITISREFGCGGRTLAAKVGEALGYHVVDRRFIGRVLCEYGFSEFDEEYESQPGFWSGFDLDKADRRDTMVQILNQAVKAVARHGNVVILGRSGYAILEGLDDVLHVRLQAPIKDRIMRVAAEQGLSQNEATALVEKKDRIRTAFIEDFYKVPWESSHAFDLAINTSLIPSEVAMKWVIEAAKLKERDHGLKPTTKTLEVDPVMYSAVTDKLQCNVDHE